MTIKEIKELAAKEASEKSGVLDQWKIQKKIKDHMNEKDANKFA
jgi:hypothetical protein